MNNAKVRFQNGGRVIEVEGSEEFVREMWSKLQETTDLQAKAEDRPSNGDDKEDTKRNTRSPNTKPRPSRSRSGEVERLRDLDLNGGDQLSPLDAYVNELKPSKHNERNLVFIDYLIKLGVAVTPSHVFTCYEELGEVAPTAFVQSLRDTAKDKKWLDVSNMDDIRLTINGRNYLKSMAQRPIQ